MNEAYLRHLGQLRGEGSVSPHHVPRDLLPTHWLYRNKHQVEEVTPVESGEKTEVLEELKDFMERQKVSEKPKEEGFFMPQDTVARRTHESILLHSNLEDLIQSFSDRGRVSRDFLESRFQDRENLKVLFVTDMMFLQGGPISGEETIKEIHELQHFLSPEVAELFYKMISAMKLNFSEYLVSSVFYQKGESKESYLDYLFEEITFFKPNLIMTLGATATSTLLGKKKILSQVHGKFFDITLAAEMNVKVMPLFHPSLLHVTPSMKALAWRDMQEAMSFYQQSL